MEDLTGRMKISLAQTHIEWENKHLNILNADKIVSTQAQNGNNLILFPEMSFTGFSMNTNLTGESNFETVKTMQDMAGKYGIAIGFGWVEQMDNKCRNIYTVLDEKGGIVSSYAKIHPFSFSGEDKYFEGGNSCVAFNFYGIPFSNFICYDLRFPEVFRQVSDIANAIIIPANWPARRSEHWKTLLRARAIENQVYIFAINCVGDVGGQYYSGDSCIINPNGDVIEIISDREGIIEYDFINDVSAFREKFPVLKDIRPNIIFKG